MREALFPGGTQKDNIVKVEDQTNSPHVEEGSQRLCHQREDERGQAKAKWENHVLVEEASPTKAKEAAIDEGVEVHILEVDRRCPIAEAKEGRRILDRIHPEAGSVEKSLVEPLVDEPPAAIFLGNDEHPGDQANRRPGDAAKAMLCQERQHLVHDHDLHRLREHCELRRKRKEERTT